MPAAADYPPIAVLLGGPSAEHDVSIISGTAIGEALAGAGLEVTLILIDLDGQWWWLPRDHRREGRTHAAYDDPRSLGADGPYRVGAAIDRLAVGVGSRPAPESTSRAGSAPSPVVFIALHGPFGEDGIAQGLLEAAGLAYTGSGVLGSAVGMDKTVQKRIWRGLGLPVVDWREVQLPAWRAARGAVLEELQAFAAAAGDPRLMIKPARLGSSVGMTLAHTPAEREQALELAFGYDTLAVVERYLAEARDLEVSVIGNDMPLGLYGPGEIVAGREFYDYAAKYTPGLSETSIRAEIPAPMRATILKFARDAYRSVGAAGFARVDFLLRGDEIYLSEINTIPGFTPISLFPTMPAEAGLDFTAVCLRVIDLALERQAARPRGRLRPEDLPR
ncbi:MAG TPA: D-alanine--D-alanine ligase family protein [Candidatus Eisenbacteria bacterium]|nr:D-alanine--D-alanine ligase family protein [Candidatus Eisenbacteria bacterium]